MKTIPFLLLLIITSSCATRQEKTPEDAGQAFYVGTYTGGESQGIYKYLLRDDGSMIALGLVAREDNPSFLALDPNGKFLLSVSEVRSGDNTGSLASYKIGNDTLLFIDKCTSGGAHPCFVAVREDGYVLAANYTGGNVGLMKIDSDGQLSEILDVQQHEGEGISNRQKGPHAHSAWFVPGTKEVISVDLGTNELWFSSIDKETNKLLPSDPQTLAMAPGAGPRHLCFHPNNKWIYVVNELDCTVTQVLMKNGAYSTGPSYSTLPADFEEQNTCADIHVSADGKFLYASNRGHNSLAIFSVDQHDGTLTALGHQSTYGDSPRNFALSPDQKCVVVANQNSNNLVSYFRNTETGLLKMVAQIEAPKPVCVIF